MEKIERFWVVVAIGESINIIMNPIQRLFE